MSAKAHNPLLLENLNSDCTSKFIPEKPLGKFAAMFLAFLSTIQGISLLLESTFYSLPKSDTGLEAILSNVCDFFLGRGVINFNSNLEGKSLTILILVLIYVAFVLSITVIYWTNLFRRLNIHIWIKSYYQLAMHVHFYCLSVPVHNILTEALVQSYRRSSGGFVAIGVICTISWVINFGACYMPFFKALNTHNMHPLAIIDDKFLMIHCFAKLALSTRNTLIIVQDLYKLAVLAINLGNMFFMICQQFLFYYTLPFVQKNIRNIFIFQIGITFLLAVSNFFLDIFRSHITNVSGLLAILIVIILIPVYMKFVLNRLRKNIIMALLGGFSYLIEDNKMKSWNRYCFIHGIYRLKSILEYEGTAKLFAEKQDFELLKQFGMISYFQNATSEYDKSLESSENRLKVVIPKLMSAWLQRHPQDHLVEVVQAELMIEEFQLIHGSYIVLENLFRSNIRRNLRLRALEIRNTFQRLIHKVQREDPTIKLAPFFEGFQLQIELKRRINIQVNGNSEFYQRIQDKEPDLLAIMTHGQKALKLRKDVTALWNTVPEKVLDLNFVLLLIYGFYKIYVNYEYQEGRELLEKYFKYAAKRQCLKTSKEFTEKTLSCDENGLVLINTNKSAFGNIVYCNKTVEKMFGRKSDHLVDKNLKILMPSFFQDIHDTFLMRKIENADDLLASRVFPTFAVDSEGFVFPVNILTALYPWVNKGFLIAGIIRKVPIKTHYILLDEQYNINCYSKSLMKTLKLPLPAKMDKINIFNLCRSIEGLPEPGYLSALKSQFSRGQGLALPSSYDTEESLVENPDGNGKGYQKDTIYSFDLKKVANSRPLSARGGQPSPLLKSPGGSDFVNFYPYGTLGNWKGFKKSKTPKARKTLERLNSKDQATFNSEFKADKLIQFKCDVVTQRYCNKELKILALEDTMAYAAQNDTNSQEISHFNIDSRRSSQNSDSEKESGKEKSPFKPRPMLSRFSQQTRFLVPKELIEESSQKPSSNNNVDSGSLEDLNSSNEEQPENEFPVRKIMQFPSRDYQMVRTLSRGNKETSYTTDMNLNLLESTTRKLVDQYESQGDIPLSTLRRRRSIPNEFLTGRKGDKETEDEFKKNDLSPLKLQDDTLVSPATVVTVATVKPLIKKVTKQITDGSDSQEFEENQVDYEGDNCVQFLSKYVTGSKPKLNQIDLKKVLKSLPFAKFFQAILPVHLLLITLVLFLSASAYSYSISVSNLPAIGEGFSALRESLDRVIIIADINYRLNSMIFFLVLFSYFPAYKNTYVAYQGRVQTDVNQLITINADLIQKMELFSSDYRMFVYNKNLKIYVDDFGNYSSPTNYLILDSEQALNQVTLRASEVATTNYTEVALITEDINFLLCNMFNNLLIQLQEVPNQINIEIHRFIHDLSNATNVSSIVIVVFSAVTMLALAAVYVKSYIDTRDFLEHFLYFDQNRLSQVLNGMDPVRKLIESNLHDKNAFHSFRQKMKAVHTKEARINWNKVSKVTKLKIKMSQRVSLIIITLIFPVLLVILYTQSYDNNFKNIPETINNILKPKRVAQSALLILSQLGIYSSGIPYKVYDRDVKTVLAESIQDLDNLITEAELPTTSSNFELLHGDLCQFVNPANVTLCEGLLRGIARSGLVGSVAGVNSFAKYWKSCLDAGNIFGVQSSDISNAYVFTTLIVEAINTVEAGQTEQMSTYLTNLKEYGVNLMILSSVFGFVIYLFDIGFLYLPSKKEREDVSQLILLVPFSIVLSNNRLKLYLRKNSGTFRDATKPK